MATAKIIELTTDDELEAGYEVMQELRPLEEEVYFERLGRMREEGYRQFALYEDDEIVSIAGVRNSTTLYHGKHAWVYDIVTREERRSEGFGRELLEFLESWAREEGCQVLELASGLWRDRAHSFYEDDLGYERYCYTFKKDLV